MKLFLLCFAAAFPALLFGARAAWGWPAPLAWTCVVLSAVTFTVYAHDKSAARRRRGRVPERTLHLLALAGGWPGALAGQQLLRHKSAKRSFIAVLWLCVAADGALLYGAWRLGLLA